jgi:glutathione peroxidase
MPRSIYDFTIPSIHAQAIDFAQFKGKYLLIVNTASECGYTPQYAQLQELYMFAQENLHIIACPSNDFGGQEPGTDAQIAQFCTRNYGVSFSVTTKLKVLGEQKHPLYQFLTMLGAAEVRWNFQKYLFDTEGKFVQVYAPGVTPLDESILQVIGI